MGREKKFTPGDFKVEKSLRSLYIEDGGFGVQLLSCDGRLYHCATEKYLPASEVEANLDLWAAAPLLLEELQYLRRFVNPKEVDCGPADAAIAKAYGET